jgi:hypothetical protein
MLSSTETYDGTYIFFGNSLSWEEVDMIHTILSRPDFTQVIREVVSELKNTELGQNFGYTQYMEVNKTTDPKYGWL